MFFASPRDFEDDLDFRQMVDFISLTDKEKFDWAVLFYKKRFPNDSRQQSRAKARRQLPYAPINNPLEAKKISEEHLQKYFDITGVLSLSFNPSSDKMWNKYADNHEGFCVGFDSVKLFESGIGGRGDYVRYVKELPKIYPEPKMDIFVQAHYQIFHKLEKWEFEEEYRLHIIKGTTLIVSERRRYAPAQAFKEILVGKNMPEDDFKELMKELPDDLKHVEIIKL